MTTDAPPTIGRAIDGDLPVNREDIKKAAELRFAITRLQYAVLPPAVPAYIDSLERLLRVGSA